MKLNEEKIAECVAWVEQNGLYPQACGASIKDFCAAMGIDQSTYHRWEGNESFASAISRAREIFKKNTIRAVENALVKAAVGVDFTKVQEEAKAEVIKEYDPKTGKKVREYTGEIKTVKAKKETMYYPPNVEAAKFVLTNMAAEDWKAKQETTLHAPEGMTIRVDNEDQAHLLETLGD